MALIKYAFISIYLFHNLNLFHPVYIKTPYCFCIMSYDCLRRLFYISDNDRGTVRILRPIKNKVTNCPEVQEVSEEVVLEDNNSDSEKESENKNSELDAGESTGLLLGSDDENGSNYEPAPAVRFSSRGRQIKRNKLSSSESDTGPSTSRGGRNSKKKSPDKSRPQRSYRKQYRESSESSGEPEVSISSHGRIRRIRPQVRAFLKDL